MSLARLLQPAMVVIEDVDLIARSREQMRSACDETMLNSLLNEMDGLKENSDILFILTTNRPRTWRPRSPTARAASTRRSRCRSPTPPAATSWSASMPAA